MSFPLITSSQAQEIADNFSAVIFSGFNSAFANAAAFLRIPKA